MNVLSKMNSDTGARSKKCEEYVRTNLPVGRGRGEIYSLQSLQVIRDHMVQVSWVEGPIPVSFFLFFSYECINSPGWSRRFCLPYLNLPLFSSSHSLVLSFLSHFLALVHADPTVVGIS